MTPRPTSSVRPISPVIRAAALAAAVFASTGAAAQVIPQGDVAIDLVKVAGPGVGAPDYATSAPDGSGRLFIVDQLGKIWILQGGALLPTPFLDLTAEIPVLNAGFDERGLLGLAFHPDYALNGRFFVRYSKPRVGVAGEPCFGTPRGCHEEILAEFSVSTDPNIANPAGTILFRVNKPQFNHDGGMVRFGPDGYLYFSLGDGGGANDGLADNPPSHGPIGNGQNIDTPLGKILRIDVDQVPTRGAALYGIPADNPFANGPGLDEIYAYGLRNPFQFSFDDAQGGDGALWCADVGQNLYEEIDLIVNGGNYGWVIMEGSHCFNPLQPNTPPASCANGGMIPPIADYIHAGNGISIIGGYVYRGAASPALNGQYLFGDYSTSFALADGHLFSLDTAGPLSDIRRVVLGGDNHALLRYVKGTGRDADGEIYFCIGTQRGPSPLGGEVYRVLQRRCLGDADRTGQIDMKDITQTLMAWNANYLPGTGPGDANSDGVVNFADITLILGRFMIPCVGE